MTTDLAIRDEPYNTALANREDATAALTHYLGTGDLSRLTGEQRAALYLDTCQSLNLNPRTRPFDWIEFWDPETKAKKLTLYPNRSCAEQLRRQHQIRVRVVKEEIAGELFKVVVEGATPNGRTDEATAYVSLIDKEGQRLRGQRLANAFMKGQTVAKRRLTFSMVGMFAPPDLEDLQQARQVYLDGRGNVLENPTEEQRALAADPAMARAIGESTFETVAGSSLLENAPGQRPTADELAPQRPAAGPRPTFRCDAERWKRAYFAAVQGTSLAADAGRAAFIADITSGFTPALRTDSLTRFLASASDRHAGEMVAVASLRAEAERLAAHIDRESQPTVTPEVAAAVLLTGGPAAPAGAAAPARPDDGEEYTPEQWRGFYRVWGAELRQRDSAYAVWPEARVKRAAVAELRAEVEACIGQCDSIDEAIYLADLADARSDDESDGPGY